LVNEALSFPAISIAASPDNHFGRRSLRTQAGAKKVLLSGPQATIFQQLALYFLAWLY